MTVEVSVPRQPGEPVRRCTLTLCSMPITLKPPQARKRLGKVQVWGGLATEIASPPTGEPIEWLLLTTVAVASLEEAIERVHWYTCRGPLKSDIVCPRPGAASSRANWKRWNGWSSR